MRQFYIYIWFVPHMLFTKAHWDRKHTSPELFFLSIGCVFIISKQAHLVFLLYTGQRLTSLSSENSGICHYYILLGCCSTMSPISYIQWYSHTRNFAIFCTFHLTLYTYSLGQLIFQPKIIFPQIKLSCPSTNAILCITHGSYPWKSYILEVMLTIWTL